MTLADDKTLDLLTRLAQSDTSNAAQVGATRPSRNRLSWLPASAPVRPLSA